MTASAGPTTTCECVPFEELLRGRSALAAVRARGIYRLKVKDRRSSATPRSSRGGELIELTPRVTVLEYLMLHHGRVRIRTLITEYAWGSIRSGTLVDVVTSSPKKTTRSTTGTHQRCAASAKVSGIGLSGPRVGARGRLRRLALRDARGVRRRRVLRAARISLQNLAKRARRGAVLQRGEPSELREGLTCG